MIQVRAEYHFDSSVGVHCAFYTWVVGIHVHQKFQILNQCGFAADPIGKRTIFNYLSLSEQDAKAIMEKQRKEIEDQLNQAPPT